MLSRRPARTAVLETAVLRFLQPGDETVKDTTQPCPKLEAEHKRGSKENAYPSLLSSETEIFRCETKSVADVLLLSSV